MCCLTLQTRLDPRRTSDGPSDVDACQTGRRALFGKTGRISRERSPPVTRNLSERTGMIDRSREPGDPGRVCVCVFLNRETPKITQAMRFIFLSSFSSRWRSSYVETHCIYIYIYMVLPGVDQSWKGPAKSSVKPVSRKTREPTIE